MTAIRWILALVLGGFLLMFGFLKFSGEAHIFPYIEYKMTGLGIPLAELAHPFGNFAVGGLELVAGALVILPMTRQLGAKLALVPLLGAVVFHLTPFLGVSTPTGFADPKPIDVLADGGPFARTDFAEAMTTGLFMTACVMLVVAIINLIVQRNA
ncbi:MAG: hypothetical protein AAGB02_07045 [Pseudomonadota bacterium]